MRNSSHASIHELETEIGDHYTALSHVWGVPEFRNEIFVGEAQASLLVTDSLQWTSLAIH